MKFILAILLFSVPFEGIAQTNQMLIESHVIKFKNSKTYTLSIAEKLDTDKFDFNPVKEGMSFKEQLVHIGENIYWLSSIYINEEINPINTNKTRASEMNKEQVLQFLASAYDYAIKAMSEVDEKTLSKEFNWSGGKLVDYVMSEVGERINPLLSSSPHLFYNMDKSNMMISGDPKKLCTFLCTPKRKPL